MLIERAEAKSKPEYKDAKSICCGADPCSFLGKHSCRNRRIDGHPVARRLHRPRVGPEPVALNGIEIRVEMPRKHRLPSSVLGGPGISLDFSKSRPPGTRSYEIANTMALSKCNFTGANPRLR